MVYHASSSKPSSQVRGASKDPAAMFRMHEIVAVLFENLLNFLSRISESGYDSLDVVTLILQFILYYRDKPMSNLSPSRRCASDPPH